MQRFTCTVVITNTWVLDVIAEDDQQAADAASRAARDRDASGATPDEWDSHVSHVMDEEGKSYGMVNGS